METVGVAPAEAEKPFAALRIVAGIFEFLAWAGLVVGGIVALMAAVDDTAPTMTSFAVAGGAALSWLIFMFTAQSITVILAIEENTRRLAEK
jgi:hypothetical protein